MPTEYKYEKQKKKKEAKETLKWWQSKGNAISDEVFEVVRKMENRNYPIWRDDLLFAQLYENLSTLSSSIPTFFFPYYFGALSTPGTFMSSDGTRRQTNSWGGKQTYNLVKSCVDAAFAKIGKNETRVKFSTSNASAKVQKKAKKLSQFVDGIFYETQFYQVAKDVLKDGEVFGTGCCRIYTEDGTIKAERIHISQLRFDQLDAMDGKPRQIHVVKLVDKGELIEKFPAFKEQIRTAPLPRNTNLTAADFIELVESWHLPSGKKAKDGLHSYSIQGTTLFTELYEKSEYPLVFYRWSKRTRGFTGVGLTEELAAIQLTLNKVIKMINVGQEINSAPRIFIQKGSKVDKHKLGDAGISEYSIAPPIFSTLPGMPPDIYTYRKDLINEGYNVTGISQLSAASQKPPGLNSGVALEEFQDINTERMAIQAKNFQQVFLDAAKIAIGLARDLYTRDKTNIEVKAKLKGKSFINTIKWTDVDLDDDDFVMEAFPVSNLPSTPEGKLEAVQQLADRQWIDRDTALELLDIPDIENEMSLMLAPTHLAKSMIEKILYDGEPQVPNKMMDLQTTIKLCGYYWSFGMENGASEENISLLEDFLAQCQRKLAENMPQQVPNQQVQNPQAPPQQQTQAQGIMQ